MRHVPEKTGGRLPAGIRRNAWNGRRRSHNTVRPQYLGGIRPGMLHSRTQGMGHGEKRFPARESVTSGEAVSGGLPESPAREEGRGGRSGRNQIRHQVVSLLFERRQCRGPFLVRTPGRFGRRLEIGWPGRGRNRSGRRGIRGHSALGGGTVRSPFRAKGISVYLDFYRALTGRPAHKSEGVGAQGHDQSTGCRLHAGNESGLGKIEILGRSVRDRHPRRKHQGDFLAPGPGHGGMTASGGKTHSEGVHVRLGGEGIRSGPDGPGERDQTNREDKKPENTG